MSSISSEKHSDRALVPTMFWLLGKQIPEMLTKEAEKWSSWFRISWSPLLLSVSLVSLLVESRMCLVGVLFGTVASMGLWQWSGCIVREQGYFWSTQSSHQDTMLLFWFCSYSLVFFQPFASEDKVNGLWLEDPNLTWKLWERVVIFIIPGE